MRHRPAARRLGRALVAVALAGLLVASLFAGVALEAGGGPSLHFVTVSLGGPSAGATDAALVPAVLDTPWAERAGFNVSEVSAATEVHPASGTVSLTITLAPTNDLLYGPAPSPMARLGATQIASEFAPTPTAYASLAGYFVSLGLAVAPAPADRLSMDVSGPVASVDRAFSTAIDAGTLQGIPVEFPSTPPSLPTPYEAMVNAVSGLSTGNDRFLLPLASVGPTPSQGGSSSITPNDIHVIYGLNDLYNFSGGGPYYATSVGIAVILWGSGYDPNDLSTFFDQIYPSQFPKPTVNPYPVDGAPSPAPSAVDDPSNSTQEMSLDIEWSASEAPGATIDAVYAPDGPASDQYSPTDAAMETAIHDAVSTIAGVDVISMSFASPDGDDLPFESALSEYFAEAEQRGITVLAASGDSGGTSGGQPACNGGLEPEFPASSPYVLAVGGTAPTLSENAFGTVTGLASEPAWDDSGGGYSSVYSAPSWQLVGSAAAPIEGNGSHRGIPDVAGPAAENLFYFDGHTEYGSGTSFATPMWAGLVAEMDALRGFSLGFISDRIYAVGAEEVGESDPGLVDITAGGNCIARATTGWDAVTGWGSPRALDLYERLAGTYVNVTVTASTGSVAPGGGVTLTIDVANATSHRPITGLPVELAMTGSFPGVCTDTLASTNGTTNVSGSATASMTVPTCYLGSAVEITATVDSGAYLGSGSVSVGVSLLGWAGLIAIGETYPYNVALFALIIGVATAVGLYFGRSRPKRTARADTAAPAAGPARATSPPPAAAPASSAPPPRSTQPSPTPSAPVAPPPADPLTPPTTPASPPPAELPPNPLSPSDGGGA